MLGVWGWSVDVICTYFYSIVLGKLQGKILHGCSTRAVSDPKLRNGIMRYDSSDAAGASGAKAWATRQRSLSRGNWLPPVLNCC